MSDAMTFEGNDIQVFRLLTIRRAIQLYLRTGLKVNRMYTPQNMRIAVSEMTGRTYVCSRKGLEMAERDLSDIVSQMGLTSSN